MARFPRFLHRLKNAALRALLRVPAGEAVPEIPNDHFQMVRAIHEFIGRTLLVQRALLLGSGSAWAAVEYERHGRSVVGADHRPWLLERARAVAGLRYVSLLKDRNDLPTVKVEAVVSVSIDSKRALDYWQAVLDLLLPFGELAVALPPPDAATFASWASLHFVEVRTFDQLAGTRPLDLRSPLPSPLRPDDFKFVERSDLGDDVALASVVIARSPQRRMPATERIHVGSGPVVLPGWTNIDIAPYPGVHVLDVTRGLPLEGVGFIFAEHFIEHLSLAECFGFLKSCRQALRDDGVLRLSTPSLDWVLSTQYRPREGDRDAVAECVALNRAFHAWGHQFLYSIPMLRTLLRAAGFTEIAEERYGESRHGDLRHLERHERYPDTDELPHVIIVEASGRATVDPSLLEPWYSRYQIEVSVHSTMPPPET